MYQGSDPWSSVMWTLDHKYGSYPHGRPYISLICVFYNILCTIFLHRYQHMKIKSFWKKYFLNCFMDFNSQLSFSLEQIFDTTAYWVPLLYMDSVYCSAYHLTISYQQCMVTLHYRRNVPRFWSMVFCHENLRSWLLFIPTWETLCYIEMWILYTSFLLHRHQNM